MTDVNLMYDVALADCSDLSHPGHRGRARAAANHIAEEANCNSETSKASSKSPMQANFTQGCRGN
jgi:hypothetical protein